MSDQDTEESSETKAWRHQLADWIEYDVFLVQRPDKKIREYNQALNLQLRLLRTELQDMISLIERAKSGKISLDAQIDYFNKTKGDIKHIFKEIDDITDKKHSDTIRHIVNVWEQMERSELFDKSYASKSMEVKLEIITLIDEQARDIILYVGYKTIPERVNDWMERARPGYVLPFHLVFEDELTNQADRKKVLNYISWKPKEISNGLVDPRNGLVYRYHERVTQRMLWVFLLVSLFPLLIYLVGDYGLDLLVDVVGNTFNDSNGNLLIDGGTVRLYLLSLFSGIYVHILIDRAKQQRDSGMPNIMPLSDWTRYLSACRGRILYKTSLALFVFIAFLVTIEDVSKLTYAQFFLAGYSLDSVVDMFSAKLEKNSSTQFSASQAQT